MSVKPREIRRPEKRGVRARVIVRFYDVIKWNNETARAMGPGDDLICGNGARQFRVHDLGINMIQFFVNS